jgi:O-antigen/teichoic acid export membrane protein
MSHINLKKNIAFSTSSQIVTMAASFVVNWFLARYLGPEKRGQYVYLFTINYVVWMLLDLGVSKSMMFSLQHDKADPNKLYSYTLVFFGIFILLALSIFHFLGSSILGQQGYSYYHPVILALGVYIVAYQMFTRQKYIFMGLNHIKDYAILNLLPSLSFMLLLIPLFWVFPTAYRMEASYLLNVGTMLLIILIYHFRLVHKLKFKFLWDWSLVLRSYGLGFKAFLSEYMMILMTRMDILILKQLGSFAQLGIYTLAINFLDMINIMANMIGIVLLNKFSATNNDAASLAILRKIFVVMLTFDLLCITGMLVVGLPVIRTLYGVQYIDSWWTFLHLIPAVIGLTLGGLFNTFLWSKGFPIFTIIAPAIATGIKALLSYLLIPHYGMFGSAISSSIAYLLWFLLLIIWYFSVHRDQHINQLLVRKEDISQIKVMLVALKVKATSKV